VGDTLDGLGFAIISLLCTGIFFFSLAEAALLGANRQILRQRAEDGDRRAQFVESLIVRGDYLAALIVGMNGSVILVSTVATIMAHRHLGEGAAVARELLHLSTIAAIMVLAELTPKTYASRYADQLAPALAPFVAWLARVFGPLVFLVTVLGNGVMRLMRMSPGYQRHIISEEDIQAAADLGEEAGLVEPEEGALLDRIIELGELTARDAMTPRVDVVALPEDASLDEALDEAAASGFSRLPVYRNDIDHIVGVVLVNDLLRVLIEGGNWQQHVREPLLVAEATPLTDLFRQMRQVRTHMAIVVDEFGGTAGVVTIEDILEEIVGEIRDEHDTAEEEIVDAGGGELVVSGRVRLDELYERLGRQPAEEEESETVAGLLAEITGRIPAAGERIEHAGMRFVVEECDAQHVKRVRVSLLENSQGGDE
jgi:CBS domain containing-hemolysin-like protein